MGGTDFVRSDVTAQNFEVRFPSDFTCKDCTLRLLRQADEWSNGYRFWSCADIDIKNRMYQLLMINKPFEMTLIKQIVNDYIQAKSSEKHVRDMVNMLLIVANVIRNIMDQGVNIATNAKKMKIAVYKVNALIYTAQLYQDVNVTVTSAGMDQIARKVSFR